MGFFLLGHLGRRSLMAAVVLLLVTQGTGAFEPTSHYVVKEIAGWQVYVHRWR